jgi:hypothetical protein
MLTIKRRFPINKLALSKAWFEAKQLFPRVRASYVGGIADLRERGQSMGKKSILSSLVLMVGFFGSLSALLILYPIATRNGGPFSGNGTQANVESQTEPSTSGTWQKETSTAGTGTQAAQQEQTKDQVPATQSQPLATSPVTPAPASSTPAPVTQAAPVTTPTLTQPSATPTPVQPTPPPVVTSPLPVTTPPPVVPPLNTPLPVDTQPITTPVTDTLRGTTDGLSGTVNDLLQ